MGPIPVHKNLGSKLMRSFDHRCNVPNMLDACVIDMSLVFGLRGLSYSRSFPNVSRNDFQSCSFFRIEPLPSYDIGVAFKSSRRLAYASHL